MTELSAYMLEPIREGPDFTLYRGRQPGNQSRVLAVALSAEHPSPQGLRRLEQRILARSRTRFRMGSQAPGTYSS
jgi:hypothetical protein